MAITRISEFTFGFAFLFEQTERTWADLIAAPVLPNLKQEEEEGWDAKLPLNGVEYFYQFKLSDYLKASHAKYRKDGPDKRYDAPYFRIALHRHKSNQQHQRLRTLCKTHPHTYYVAPEIVDLDAFNDIFLTRQIADSSRIIPLSKCKDFFDGEQHYITYQPGSTTFTEHSTPETKDGSSRGSELDVFYRRSADTWKPVDTGFAERLLESTRVAIERDIRDTDRPQRQRDRTEEETVLRLVDVEPPRRTRQTLLRRAAELSSIYFGTTLMIVGSRQGAA